MSISTATELERYMLILVNEERTSRGLDALSLDQVLNSAADAHSRWMLDSNVFSHTGAGGSSSTDRIAAEGFELSGTWRTAENIAVQSERGSDDLFDDVYDLHIALMNSAEHRANILNPDLEVIGIGIQTGDFRYDSGTYFSVMVTQKFARTDGQTTPDTMPTSLGTASDDTIIGTDQDDRLLGNGGDDILSGGDGTDTAVYTNAMSLYDVTIRNGTIVIEDRSGRDGTDTLESVEFLEFADTGFELSKFINVSTLTEADMLAFCELYIAYFNRAPDATGLLFWGSVLADGMGLNEIARYFFDQQETRALYNGSNSTQELVTGVYNNVLGREPDAQGFAFWTDVLNNGTVAQSEFILAILAGAKAATGDPADAQYLETKAEIGAYYAVVHGLTNVPVANTVMQTFDGSNRSVAEAKTLIDDHVALANSPAGSEFTISVTGLVDTALDWV